ncbi:hypothetical protein L7F22_015111 [Adiantum nelumboides]|nr:hypothetical protein [Adiantum nelumboides]
MHISRCGFFYLQPLATSCFLKPPIDSSCFSSSIDSFEHFKAAPCETIVLLGSTFSPLTLGCEIQEKLELLLEDESTEQGLKTEWKVVEDAVSLLVKQQCRQDKIFINNVTPTLVATDNEAKSPIASQKNDESSMLDELVKDMKGMKLKLAAYGVIAQTMEGKTVIVS